MAVPKQKPRQPEPDKKPKPTSTQGVRPATLDDIEDMELRAEIRAWEAASIEDLNAWEQRLSDE